MASSIRDFVREQPLVSHHDHHIDFGRFERDRETLDYTSLLSYLKADLASAEGNRPLEPGDERALVANHDVVEPLERLCISAGQSLRAV